MNDAAHPAAVSTDGAAGPAGTPSVFADLRIVSDDHRLHLVGDGRSLVLHSSDPRKLAAALRGVPLPAGIGGSGRRAVGRAATTLRDNGLRVEVRGPEGVLLELGGGRGSRLGQLVTGSPAVRFGGPRELAATAGVPLRAIRMAAIAAVVTTAIAVGAKLLRRR